MTETLTPNRPALTRRLYFGQLCLGLGQGLVTPSWFLYFSEVRAFGATVAGYSFTLRAIGMIAIVPLAGWLIDRTGTRAVVLLGTVCTCLGVTAMGLSPWPQLALCGSFLFGAGTAFSAPATRVVLMNAVPLDTRERASTTSFTLFNVGIGLGSLVGGFAASPDSLAPFVVLFLASGVLAVVTRVVNLAAIPRGRPPRAPRSASNFHAAAKSPAFVCYLLVALALNFGGYGQTSSGVPGLATILLGVSTQIMGVAFAVNTAVIVLMSPAAIRLARRLRRSTVLISVGLVWALAWLVLAVDSAFDSVPSGPAIVLFYVIFSIGQASLAAVAVPLIASLAPQGGLGTFISLDTLTRQIGMALGPLASGFLIADQAASAYVSSCLCSCLIASAGGLALRRLLSNSSSDQAEATP